MLGRRLCYHYTTEAFPHRDSNAGLQIQSLVWLPTTLWGRMKKHQDVRWVSTDRRSSLLSCVQHSIHAKSSTSGLLRRLLLSIRDRSGLLETSVFIFARRFPESMCFSMVWGLEAFSPEPTDDSFAAWLFSQPWIPIIWIRGSSRTNLNYWRIDKLISRVKLTCLTTV